jgi:mRNA interferase MazF
MEMKAYRKWQVVLVDLNPVKGKEISKIRPCLIISPDVANKHLFTVIIAPFTSTIRNIPTRLTSSFQGSAGEICFDQVRAIDKSRIIKILGELDITERRKVNQLMAFMFIDPEL